MNHFIHVTNLTIQYSRSFILIETFDMLFIAILHHMLLGTDNKNLINQCIRNILKLA